MEIAAWMRYFQQVKEEIPKYEKEPKGLVGGKRRKNFNQMNRNPQVALQTLLPINIMLKLRGSEPSR
jgi:hypothetical protein